MGSPVDVQGDGTRSHQAAEDGTGRPHRVQGVDDGPPVALLDAQTVRVLGDIGDRIARAAQNRATASTAGPPA